MYEPPSEQLVRQLTDLQLCLPSDLRRARRRVHKLSFDLPAYDSVWIDSLVQLRLLTPYQAKQLETGRADRLRVGPFVAIDELGHSLRGTTKLARRLNRRDRCVIKTLFLPGRQVVDIHRQLEAVLEQLGGFVHPQLVVPHEILSPVGDEVSLVSRFVPGLPLNQLLVRRGRFPATVVLEIGRQLLEGLAALNTRSLVHGDIRLSNIRLTESGLAVLVNGAIQPVILPHRTIHDDLALDHYDGIAPELIGTGSPATASSELYALGCVLWQLLAGRPPHISADPLVKLASHQAGVIEDVRTWAPDTPAALAESIQQLTAPDSEMRPRSFEDVLQNWGRPTSNGRSRLRQFRRLFEGAVPHFAKPATQDRMSNVVWTAATLFAVIGGMGLFYENGFRKELLEIAQKVQSVALTKTEAIADSSTSSNDSAHKDFASQTRTSGLLPLPDPDADGVIELTEQGPYEASQQLANGPLVIRGLPGVDAEIHIGETSLHLTSPQVRLENVTIRQTSSAQLMSLVMVQSNQLTIQNCQFLGISAESASDTPQQLGPVTVLWNTPNKRSVQNTLLAVHDSVFHHHGIAIGLGQTPRSIIVENSLKTGSGELLSLGPKCEATELTIRLQQVTLRDCGSLLWVSGKLAQLTAAPPISIDASNCVLKMAADEVPLIVLEANSPRADAARSVVVQAPGSIVEPGAKLLALFDSASQQFHSVEADEQFEGLVASEIKFQGDNTQNASDNRIAHFQGPRISEDLRPGIDSSRIGIARNHSTP